MPFTIKKVKGTFIFHLYILQKRIKIYGTILYGNCGKSVNKYKVRGGL
jgi:hypothetical protein